MVSSCSRWAVMSLWLGVLGVGCTGFNKSPVVREGPTVSSSEVVSGAEVRTHLVVTDEEGDALTYQWLQAPEEPSGAFSDTSAPEPSWTAPVVTATQSFQLKVIIMDAAGGTLVSWTSIQVKPR
jgi:hypothetical protein